MKTPGRRLKKLKRALLLAAAFIASAAAFGVCHVSERIAQQRYIANNVYTFLEDLRRTTQVEVHRASAQLCQPFFESFSHCLPILVSSKELARGENAEVLEKALREPCSTSVNAANGAYLYCNGPSSEQPVIVVRVVEDISSSYKTQPADYVCQWNSITNFKLSCK